MMEDQKIKNAAAAIASAGLSATEFKKACEKAARGLQKTGMTIWRLTAKDRYKLHRKAKRFGCNVHPRLHIININHKTLDSLNSKQRAVLDRLDAIGYSIQTEI
jgi:hypothetical protein